MALENIAFFENFENLKNLETAASFKIIIIIIFLFYQVVHLIAREQTALFARQVYN